VNAVLIGVTVGIMIVAVPFMMGVVAGLVEAWMEERND
jgi:hypothetical protein